MAKVFGKRAGKASDAFQALVTRIADARAGVLPEADALAVLDAAQGTAAEADAAVLLAKSELTSRQQRAADHAVNKASRDAAQRHLATLTQQRDAALERVCLAEQALEADQAVRSDSAAIRAAAAQLPGEDTALAALRASYAAADAGVRAELDPWRDAAQRRAAADQRRAAARARLTDEQAILAAVASKGALREAAEAERGAVAGAEAALEALGAKHVAGLGERVTALRAGHEEVIDTAFDPKATSARVLAADDVAVAAAIEVPKRQAAAKEMLRAARERQAGADRKVAEAESLAAREADLPAARADLAAAEAELQELLAGHAVAIIAAFARAIHRLEVALAGKAKAAEIEPLRKQAARLAALEAAEGRLVELEKQAFTDQTQAERLRVQISEIEDVEIGADLGEAPDVVGAERAVTAAEASAKEAAGHVARAEQNVARSREVDARVSKLETERDAVAAELADWTRLEQDFGRKGIQSAEVDSSGPELTELCNDLLHRCHGPQFTVQVQTQRLDGDAKKLIEECNVTVFDSVKGTKKELRQHSGGEKVLLGIAMRLALSMMACRKAGFSDFTFVCDEGGAALDPANNRAFVAMLRHALAITGARHVLLISHSEEVQKMCDHVIEIPRAA
jgi:hypothetical protein